MNNSFLNVKYKERDKNSNKFVNNATTDIFESSSNSDSKSTSDSKSVDSCYSVRTMSSESKNSYTENAGTEINYINYDTTEINPNPGNNNDSSSQNSSASSICTDFKYQQEKEKETISDNNYNSSDNCEETSNNYDDNIVVDLFSIDTDCESIIYNSDTESNNNVYLDKSCHNSDPTKYIDNACTDLNSYNNSDSKSDDYDNKSTNSKDNIQSNSEKFDENKFTESNINFENNTDNITEINSGSFPDYATTCIENLNINYNDNYDKLSDNKSCKSSKDEYASVNDNDLTTNIFKDTSSESIISDDGSLLSNNECISNVICKEGEKGDKGDNGCKGNKGEMGNCGSKGNFGSKGDIGDKGEPGNIGPSGIKGNKGLNGERGPRGYRGIDGSKGDKGLNGFPGNSGPKGNKGSKGNIGPKGMRGPQGIGGGNSFLGGITNIIGGNSILWLESYAASNIIDNITWLPIIENDFISIFDQDNKFLVINTPGIYSVVFRISLELTNPVVIYKADDINFYKKIKVKIQIKHNVNNTIYSQEAFLGAELSKKIYNIPFYINLEEDDKISVKIDYLNSITSGVNLITGNSNFTSTKVDIIYLG